MKKLELLVAQIDKPNLLSRIIPITLIQVRAILGYVRSNSVKFLSSIPN